jgi:transposase-like protein
MIERKPNRTYTAAERTEAVALALSSNPKEAARQTGIPHRTISSWLTGERSKGQLAPIIAATAHDLEARMLEVLTLSTEQVLAGLKDPRSRLGDRVRAMETSLDAVRLLRGQSTGNLAVAVNGADAEQPLSDDEAAQLADWLRLHDADIRAAEAQLALTSGETEEP